MFSLPDSGAATPAADITGCQSAHALHLEAFSLAPCAVQQIHSCTSGIPVVIGCSAPCPLQQARKALRRLQISRTASMLHGCPLHALAPLVQLCVLVVRKILRGLARRAQPSVGGAHSPRWLLHGWRMRLAALPALRKAARSVGHAVVQIRVPRPVSEHSACTLHMCVVR